MFSSKGETHDRYMDALMKTNFQQSELHSLNGYGKHHDLFSVGLFRGGFWQHLGNLLSLEKGINDNSSVF